MMIKEYSYGAVIYKRINNELFFLVEYMGLGHVSLPKGHIEKDESVEDCVKREIFEELGIKVDVDYKKSRTITYSPKENVIKDVTFFIATNQVGDIIVDNNEVIKAEYLNYQNALDILTYNSDKETIKWAYEILR